ncbi:DUF3291 domain-containing protein [Kitasatospora sp. NPDC089509]|uniref:DUF3291 domain-containing protein n=1 Tax=Kitasatospora sp. NPDC089509 TaxID=3364079 RepID=UPI00382FCF3F
MPQLALYTFGTLKSPLADPAPLTREFHDSAEPIYQTISEHPGYLGHAVAAEGARGTHFELDWGAWGTFAVPTWYGKGRTPETMAFAASLSRWTDLRLTFDAIYTGLHRAALNRRHDWFERTEHPPYVLWWVADGEVPTWQDGVSRLERLHGEGSAPDAFSFRHAFAPDGTPVRVKDLAPKGGDAH